MYSHYSRNQHDEQQFDVPLVIELVQLLIQVLYKTLKQ